LDLQDDDEYDVGEYPTYGRVNNIRPSSFSTYYRSSPSYSSNYSYHPQPQILHNSPPHSTTLDSDDTVFDEYEEFEHEAFVEKEKKGSTGVSHILKTTRTKFASPPNHTRCHSKERKRWSSASMADDATTVTVLSTSANDSLYSPSPAAHQHPLPLVSSQYQEKEEVERERSERTGRDLEQEIEGETWTPTCTQALRREWQAVSLRIRFGVFRAQRKLRSRFASLA